MSRVIDVNWEEVYNISKEFEDQSKKMLEMKNSLKEVVNTIDDNWKGINAENYKKSIDDFSKTIYKDSIFLDIWSKFLSKSAGKYNDNIDAELQQLKVIEEETNQPILGSD